jgi:hypothetical protein
VAGSKEEEKLSSMIKRLFRIGMAVTTAAVLATWSAPRAYAQVSASSDGIAYTGPATVVVDNVGGCGDPPEISGPETPHVDSLGGCGSFTFSSIACAGWSDPETNPLIVESGR